MTVTLCDSYLKKFLKFFIVVFRNVQKNSYFRLIVLL